MKENKKGRVVFVTCLNENKEINYENIWDKIIKEKLEKKYGKIK